MFAFFFWALQASQPRPRGPCGISDQSVSVDVKCGGRWSSQDVSSLEEAQRPKGIHGTLVFDSQIDSP